MPLPLTDKRLARRFQLLWMMAHQHGACWSCAQWYAWIQVDSEFAFTTPIDDTTCQWFDACEEAMRVNNWPYQIEVNRAA